MRHVTRTILRRLIVMTMGSMALVPAMAEPSQSFELTCNGKASCQIDDTLQIKRLVSSATLKSVEVTVARDAAFKPYKRDLTDDERKSGVLSVSLPALLSAHVKGKSRDVEFWQQQAAGGTRNMLPLELKLIGESGASGASTQTLNVDFSPMWSSGAMRLHITSAQCGGSATCKLGDALVLTVPALPLWQSATKADINKVSLVINGTVLPALPKSVLAKSPATLRFELERGLSPSATVDPWLAVIRSLTPEQATTEVALATDQGVALSEAWQDPTFKLAIPHELKPVAWVFTAGVFGAFFLVIWLGDRLVRNALPLQDLAAKGLSAKQLADLRRCMPYSLGKSQMLFWTMVVVACWCYLFYTTGFRPWTFNDTALLLMGISGATALGATAGDTALPAAALQVIDAPANQALDLAKFKDAVGAVDWVRDITSDAGTNETGLHRLQNLLFTGLFGGYFVYSTFDALAMPVFPASALALIGISGTAYVGYKFADRK